MILFQRTLLVIAAAAAISACRGPTDSREGFLGGNEISRDIGLVLDSAGRSLIVFQVGDPNRRLFFDFSASPTDFAVREVKKDTAVAAVALGSAGLVALVDLDTENPTSRSDRLAVFPGEIAAVAFAGRDTVLAVNRTSSSVGLIEFGETGGSVKQTVAVPRGPRRILHALGRAYVLSDNNGGEGIITILDTRTLEILGSVRTGGTNPRDMAWGSADRLYVVNAGTGASDGTLGVVSALTPELLEVIRGMGTSPSRIFVDTEGRAYISSRSTGTLVWDTERTEFLAGGGPERPLCPSPCPGATDAHPDEEERVFQTLSTPRSGEVHIWRRDGDEFISDGAFTIGAQPIAIQIRRFGE